MVIAHPLWAGKADCTGHLGTNIDDWLDARGQAGHEVIVDAAPPAEKPGTEQDWWRAIHITTLGRLGVVRNSPGAG